MIYAIADLHLPSSLNKTMDRFGDHWVDHPEKIRRNWNAVVKPEDSVLVCGDISWALRPREAQVDLEYLASLPGVKYLIRGNHDYWWRRADTRLLQSALPADIVLLQGEGRVIEGIGVGGTRGWRVESDSPGPQDAKILARELAYLRKALSGLPSGPRVAMLHYPPYDTDLAWNAFGQILVEMQVDLALFGHLHMGNVAVLQGMVHGVELQLVAADRVGFCPQPLRL